MPGDVFPIPGDHKRPHEENNNLKSDNNNTQQHWFDHSSTSASNFRNIHLVGEGLVGSLASFKRARLFGEYREHNSSVMDSSDEEGETTLCSNVAVRSASEGTNSGRWLLRSSPSNFSITSTLTEVSDTVETVSAADGDLPEDPSGPPCYVLEGKTEIDVKERMEDITSRVDNWSLTRMKTMRISNLFSAVTELPDTNATEAMSESRRFRIHQTKKAKREVMRALQRSNSTVTD